MTFSGLVPCYINVQFWKYLFQLLAFGALSGHAREAPRHRMGGTRWGSLAGRRTEALKTELQANATHFTRWNERISGNDYFLTQNSLQVFPWYCWITLFAPSENQKIICNISLQKATPSLHANFSYVWWPFLCQNHTISIHVNIFPNCEVIILPQDQFNWEHTLFKLYLVLSSWCFLNTKFHLK